MTTTGTPNVDALAGAIAYAAPSPTTADALVAQAAELVRRLLEPYPARTAVVDGREVTALEDGLAELGYPTLRPLAYELAEELLEAGDTHELYERTHELEWTEPTAHRARRHVARLLNLTDAARLARVLRRLPSWRLPELVAALELAAADLEPQEVTP